MGCCDRVRQRARIAVGSALRIVLALRLQLVESAPCVPKSDGGARFDKPRLLVYIGSGPACGQGRGRRSRVTEPSKLEFEIGVLEERLIGKDALWIAVAQPLKSRGRVLIVAAVALGRSEEEERVVSWRRGFVGRERHPLDGLH